MLEKNLFNDLNNHHFNCQTPREWLEMIRKMGLTAPLDMMRCISNLMKKDSVKILSNYVTSDYLGFKKNNPEIKLPSSKNFVELINLVAENKISSRVAKDVLAMIVFNDESPLKIATEKNLLQSNDESALKGIVEKIIKENPEVVATYKGGKENAMMSLVGKIIKESNGSANPQIVIKLLKEMLT